MTAIDQLIADMQELKKTKLYASSFKAIDDCIFLANYHKKAEKEQIIESYRNGRCDQQSSIKSNFYNRMAEQYYNETFKMK